MINVKNKKTIKKVANSSFKSEKLRNIFAVIAIVLTTVLFCGLFAISSSLLASMEEATARQVGSKAHAGIKFLTVDEYDKISRHPDIKEISYSVALGSAENAGLKRQSEIRYTKDELFAEMFFAMPTTGRLPKANNELATDTLVLNDLGIEAQLGQIITLEFSVCGEKYTESFTLVGFWDGDIILPSSQIWLSKEYIDGILGKYDLKSLGKIIGSINAEFNFNNSWNLEKKLQNVICESGLDSNDINGGVNWAYSGGKTIELSTVLGIVLILASIIFCGYLMISNVFMISVAKDVCFYGLLKTIGTTGKQIKIIIRRQALLICAIGIPIGLIIGCILGRILVPIVLENLNIGIVKVSIRWWVYLFTALFSIITVLISTHKAGMIASKICPIDALRMTDVSGNNIKKRKSGEKICLWKMASENVGRNRKRLYLVVLSLSLSMIILNGAYSMSDSLNMDAYLSDMISHDFVVSDISWFNPFSKKIETDSLNSEFMNELSEQKGIESFGKVYYSTGICDIDYRWDNMAERVNEELDKDNAWIELLTNMISDGFAVYNVYGVDDNFWKDVKVFQGEIDLEKLYSGKYVVVSAYDDEGKVCAYKVGETIEVFNSAGESRNCEIIAIGNIPYGISCKRSTPAEINILIPSDVFLEYVEEKCPMLVTLDVEDAEIDNMEQLLSEKFEIINPRIQHTSKASLIKEYEDTQRTYKIVGIVISVLLAFIGIANFANTCITSIVARKHELAILESIGMTLKQQRNMLLLEGLIYIIYTIVFTCTIGTLIGYYGLSLFLSGSDYYTIVFTIKPALLCMPLFLIIIMIIPIVSQRFVCRESIVERLRRTE